VKVAGSGHPISIDLPLRRHAKGEENLPKARSRYRQEGEKETSWCAPESQEQKPTIRREEG